MDKYGGNNIWYFKKDSLYLHGTKTDLPQWAARQSTSNEFIIENQGDGNYCIKSKYNKKYIKMNKTKVVFWWDYRFGYSDSCTSDCYMKFKIL